MRCRCGVGTTIFMVPQIGSRSKSDPWWSMRNSGLVRLTFDIIVRQCMFPACLCTNSSSIEVAEISATPCGVSKNLFVASHGIILSIIASTKCRTVSVSSGVCIAKRGMSSLDGVLSVLLVVNLESVSAAYYFIPAPWTT